MGETGRALKVWCLLKEQEAYVKPVAEAFAGGAEFYIDSVWDPQKMLAAAPDIVLCVNDFHFDVTRCLDAARKSGIPSLVLQDGILEWRCQYENPLFGAGGGAPQHQPVLADKIACIGNQSARHIAAWGNAGKVEVTGMPRLDYLLSCQANTPSRPGKRILVMTAKKPWFDDAQKALTLQSLTDLRDYLSGRSGLEIVWRITKGLETELGVENRLRELDTCELSQIIAGVDAVISMPSTAMLEAMLLGRPVAVLDYHNVPRFVPSAWTISSPGHIGAVVDEILAPAESKMLFQKDSLNDCLRTDGSASQKVMELILKMTEFAALCKNRGLPLRLPPRLIEGENFDSGREQAPELSGLYQGEGVFEIDDAVQLKVRLARAEKENADMKAKLAARGPGYWIYSAGRFIYRLCQKRGRDA